MTNLSPAAQAVMDAALEHSGPAFEPLVRKMVTDALRALAVRINGADAIRQDILDIADELEAAVKPAIERGEKCYNARAN
jgi:hypothetical protein